MIADDENNEDYGGWTSTGDVHATLTLFAGRCLVVPKEAINIGSVCVSLSSLCGYVTRYLRFGF